VALEPGGLTDAIDRAFATEWAKAKPIPLPGAGGEDRRLLFAAVARGVLEYLSDHQAELITAVTLKQTGTDSAVRYTASETALDIDAG